MGKILNEGARCGAKHIVRGIHCCTLCLYFTLLARLREGKGRTDFPSLIAGHFCDERDHAFATVIVVPRGEALGTNTHGCIHLLAFICKRLLESGSSKKISSQMGPSVHFVSPSL